MRMPERLLIFVMHVMQKYISSDLQQALNWKVIYYTKFKTWIPSLCVKGISHTIRNMVITYIPSLNNQLRTFVCHKIYKMHWQFLCCNEIRHTFLR